jgi:hypothetical protein
MALFRRVTAIAKPVFLTARPEEVREVTRSWISRHLGITNPLLLMRASKDHRASVHLKEDQLLKLRDVHDVALSAITAAYDDRPEIVAMYQQRGITAHIVSIHSTCAYTKPIGWINRQPPLPTSCVVATREEMEALEALASQQVRRASDAPKKPRASVTAADVLGEMATTFRERNAVYGDNFKMVAKLMAVLFPKGVPPELVVQDQFHLFELILVKLSRYAISNLTHIDSVHDLAVYGAMCESINRNTTGESS